MLALSCNGLVACAGAPRSAMEEVSASAKTPADFLKSIKGKPVVVKLNSGVDYRGGAPAHEC